ncbi:MAG TPA: hypothetical protein VNQ97_16120 [Burkholderiaceae bacterium]|nr:hypothetical protein [Burkholderiaceae bacterium]
MKIKFVIPISCALSAFTGLAVAQSPAPISATELQSTVVGKKVEHLRLSDKRTFIWDVRPSGTLFIQNTSLKGKWNITDKGEFCIKWEAARVPDKCYFFYKINGLSTGYTTSPGEITSEVKSIK